MRACNIRRHPIFQILIGLFLTMPISVKANDLEFRRAMALGDLIHAENQLLYKEIANFFPGMEEDRFLDTPHRWGDVFDDFDVPDRLVGDQYFNYSFVGLRYGVLINCIRVDLETQTALLRELGHPLRGRFMDRRTTEMKDIGEFSVIMDCEMHFLNSAFSVGDAVEFLDENGFDVVSDRSRDNMEGLPEDIGAFDVEFQPSDRAKSMHGVLRGHIHVNGSIFRTKFRFVAQEAMIG